MALNTAQKCANGSSRTKSRTIRPLFSLESPKLAGAPVPTKSKVIPDMRSLAAYGGLLVEIFEELISCRTNRTKPIALARNAFRLQTDLRLGRSSLLGLFPLSHAAKSISQCRCISCVSNCFVSWHLQTSLSVFWVVGWVRVHFVF